MNEDKYISLLQKELTGELSSAEKAALDDWLGSSSDNQLIAESIRKGWDLSEGYTKDIELNLDTEYLILQQKLKASQAKVVKMRSPRRWLSIAAALLVLIAAALALPRFFEPEQNWLTEHAAQGESISFLLADGTKVWLNEETTFEYPEAFNGKERRVKLTGEAFFEVTENPAQAFVIEGKDGEVTVLGTSFNVRDYFTEKKTVVTVRSGKVQFQPKKGGKKVILEQNEQVVFDKNSKQLLTSIDERLTALGWHTKFFSFQDTPLRQVLEEIAEAYNVEIGLRNGDMFDCPVTTNFDDHALELILEILETSYSIKFVKDNFGNYITEGGICPEQF